MINDDGLLWAVFVMDGFVTSDMDSDVFLVGGSLSCGRWADVGCGDGRRLATSCSPDEDLLELFIISVSSLLQALARSSRGLFNDMV